MISREVEQQMYILNPIGIKLLVFSIFCCLIALITNFNLKLAENSRDEIRFCSMLCIEVRDPKESLLSGVRDQGWSLVES